MFKYIKFNGDTFKTQDRPRESDIIHCISIHSKTYVLNSALKWAVNKMIKEEKFNINLNDYVLHGINWEVLRPPQVQIFIEKKTSTYVAQLINKCRKS